MPSLGIEKDLAAQIIGLFSRCAHNVFPGLIVSQKHALVFSAPAFDAVSPIGSHKVQNLP